MEESKLELFISSALLGCVSWRISLLSTFQLFYMFLHKTSNYQNQCSTGFYLCFHLSLLNHYIGKCYCKTRTTVTFLEKSPLQLKWDDEKAKEASSYYRSYICHFCGLILIIIRYFQSANPTIRNTVNKASPWHMPKCTVVTPENGRKDYFLRCLIVWRNKIFWNIGFDTYLAVDKNY